MDNLRVSELAKELNITSKELIEKFAEISITVKSHSNVVSPEQIRKIKEHLGVAPKKSAAKKAFIVKKAKPSEEPEVVKAPVKEPFDTSSLDEKELLVYNTMEFDKPCSIEDFSKIDIEISELASIITMLEIKGAVESAPGGFYIKK